MITRYTYGKYSDGFFDMLKKNHKYKNSKNEKGSKNKDIFEFNYGEQQILVTHTTSHKSKWLEADYVIVDYVNQNEKYNFPSSFEDDPILLIITKDKNDWYLFAEERRIFYVSMTRGKKKSYLVYTTGKQSSFLEDLVELNKEQNKHILEIDFESESTIIQVDNLPDCPDCEGKLRLRSNSFTWEDFWWCSNYPLCNYTKELNEKKAPKCPKCKILMKLRSNNSTWEQFWWCPNYPICKKTRELD